MGRALALVAAAAVAIGWSVATPAPAAASCAFVVVRHDHAYLQVWSPRAAPPVRGGSPLPGTLEPGCSDVGGVPAPAPTSVMARRIAGVPPAVAVLVRGQALVTAGYLSQVSAFPLRGPVVDESKGCHLGATASLAGTARWWSAGLAVASGGRQIDVFVDAHTQVAGLSRHGLPYVGDGQRVRVDAVHCGHRIIARRIAAAGPIVPETTAEDVLGRGWRGDPPQAASASHDRRWAAGAAAVTAALAGGVLILRRRPGAPRRG